jgi:hypothetical protein
MDGIAMAQTLGDTMGAGSDVCLFYDGHDTSTGCRGSCQGDRRDRPCHAYCNRIQTFGCNCEALRAEATEHLVSALRRRAGQKRIFAPVWGSLLHLASDHSKNFENKF